MKKLLSALVALAMVGSMSVMAFAEDSTDEVIVDVTEVEVTDAADDETTAPVELEGVDMDELKDIASDVKEGILSLIDSGKIEEAFNDVLDTISNLSLDDLYTLDSSKAADILTNIVGTLESWGVDVDALYAKVKDSKLVNLIANLYVPDKKPTTTEAPETTTVAPETTVVEEEVVETGSASAVAAFAVMSVAAAAAFVTYKKKAE